jgi:hypothetical protein
MRGLRAAGNLMTLFACQNCEQKYLSDYLLVLFPTSETIDRHHETMRRSSVTTIRPKGWNVRLFIFFAHQQPGVAPD